MHEAKNLPENRHILCCCYSSSSLKLFINPSNPKIQIKSERGPMRKHIFIILALINFSVCASACPFEGSQLSELSNSSDFSLGPESPIDFPEALFKAFERRLSAFNAEECRQAISFREIIHKPSSRKFFAVYTSLDRCDGGNTYGFILNANQLKKDHVLALIQDSFIFCQ